MDEYHVELINAKMKAFSPSSKIIDILEKTESCESNLFKKYWVIAKSEIPLRKTQIITARIIQELYAEFRVVSR